MKLPRYDVMGWDADMVPFDDGEWVVARDAEAEIELQKTLVLKYKKLDAHNQMRIKELEEENKCLKEKECTSATCEVFAENQRFRDKMLEAIAYIKRYRHSKGMVVLQDALQDKEE